MEQLKIMVNELACLNEVFDFNFEDLSDVNKKYDMAKLEFQAQKIRQNIEVQFDFLDGESSSVDEITEFYSVQYLKNYLNEVFELLCANTNAKLR